MVFFSEDVDEMNRKFIIHSFLERCVQSYTYQENGLSNVQKLVSECNVCTGNKSIQKYLDNLVMVKWCNKYGEMVQRIRTSSHGEMVPR